MVANGYNPMLWDFQRQGCFNKKKRPKIEMLSECLPGKIAVSDIDGIIEISGNFLVLEFKEHNHIPRGQQILFQRMTRNKPFFVLIIEADVETMTVYGVNYVADGKIEPQREMDLAGLKKAIAEWSEWAQKNPVR